MVQTQRDEAEMSATRAREKAHRLYQERIVAAAREEGRKYGFEAGFKRAHEEHNIAGRQANQRRNHKSSRIRTERNEQVYPPVEDAHVVQQLNGNREVVHDNGNLLSPISSRIPLRGLAETNSPEVIRVDQPPLAPSPAQRPPLEVHPPSPLPAEPALIVQPTPTVPPTYSPSIPPVQIYTVDIPPTAEIEQRFGRNELMRKPTQPWVTANQHLEMSHQQQQQMLQEQFEGIFQADLPRDMPQPAAGSSGKRKESWYATLRRKTFGRKRKQEAPNGAPTGPPVDVSQSSQSWYRPVHVRDFGAPPRPRSSIDSGSVSTRVSQLDIVSTPDGSVSGRTGKLGGAIGRRFKQNLHVISEDPMSREATPVKENPGHRQSRSVDDTSSFSYFDSKVVDEWRKSSASTPRTTVCSYLLSF
jgi:hypothetical protein